MQVKVEEGCTSFHAVFTKGELLVIKKKVLTVKIREIFFSYL